MIDLVCLVADKNMEAVVDAVLRRPESLGIRPITHRILRHPQKDSGCFHHAVPFLRPVRSEARHALVMLDRAWDGPPGSAKELEAAVEGNVRQLGPDWARCVVIDPVLEVWLFQRSPILEVGLGWRDREPSLQAELAANGLWPRETPKPRQPKEAVEWALRLVKRPRSSAIYGALAGQLGTQRCTDASFQRFVTILRSWFAPVP